VAQFFIGYQVIEKRFYKIRGYVFNEYVIRLPRLFNILHEVKASEEITPVGVFHNSFIYQMLNLRIMVIEQLKKTHTFAMASPLYMDFILWAVTGCPIAVSWVCI
jgi:hypothetical protein